MGLVGLDAIASGSHWWGACWLEARTTTRRMRLPCPAAVRGGVPTVSTGQTCSVISATRAGVVGRGLEAPAGVVHVLRWLLGVAAAGSGVVCVATAALVAWSYAAEPRRQVGRATPAPAKYREVALGGGRLAVSTIETFPPPAGLGGGYPYGAELSEWNVAGLRWRREAITIQRPGDRAVVAVASRNEHLRALAGLAAAPVGRPAGGVAADAGAAGSSRERRKGMCRVCGYDLRASPELLPRVWYADHDEFGLRSLGTASGESSRLNEELRELR